MKDHVALTLCYFCGEPDKILLATKYSHTKNGMEPITDLGPLNNRVVDMDPCNKCQDWMKQGIIMMTFDPAKSEYGWNKKPIPNPYRTGGWFVLKEDAVRRILTKAPEMLEFALKHRWMYVEDEAAYKMGFRQTVEKGNK